MRKLIQRFARKQRRVGLRRPALRLERLEARLALAAVDLGVVKDGPATVIAGTDITYTLSVTNNGAEDATDVSLTDTVPTGTTFVDFTPPPGASETMTGDDISVTIPTLTSGDTAIATLVVHVDPSTADGTMISNTASVAPGSGDTDDIGANDSSTVDTAVSTSADVSITKVGPASINADTDITYSLTVTNNGPSDAQNVMTSDLPPSNTSVVSFNGPANGSTLAAGASLTYTLILHVNSDAPDGATLTNTANVSTDTPDSNTANNTDTVDTTVVNHADVSIVKTGPATVMAGTDITYTITVTNNGPLDAQNVMTSDLPPSNTSVVSFNGPANGSTLAAGASLTYTLILHVNSDAPDGATLTNTANVSTDTPDNNTANNSDTVDSTVVNHADVSIVKTGPATALAGTDITYTITVTNNGPLDAQNVMTSDTPPPNTSVISFTGPSNIPTLAVGGMQTYTLILHVNADAPDGATLTNTANVSSDTPDSNVANNTATFDTTIVQTTDLSITKTDNQTSVAPGATDTYTIVVTNLGPGGVTGATIADAFPIDFTGVPTRPAPAAARPATRPSARAISMTPSTCPPAARLLTP